VASGVGALVIIAGALWSAFALWRTSRRPGAGTASAIPAGRLALTNVLIAVGALVLGTGGTLFGTGDRMVDFGIWLAVGVSVLFAGFLVSNPPRGRESARERLSPYWAELYDIATGPGPGEPEPSDVAA